MKTSVVISTYNGEKYIIEQLESIYNQIRQPDEVLIKDDCSTDTTVELVKAYIQDHNLQNQWKLIVNEKNLGWRRNFIELIKFASGDLIFLCDQDDIWMAEKIRKMEKVFEENPQIKLLASEVSPFFDNSKPHKIYQPKLGNKYVAKIEFDQHILDIRRPGCSYGIKKELTFYIDDIWFDEWSHDAFLWTMAICQDGLYSLNEELIQYRRHNMNNSPSNEKNKGAKVQDIKYKIKIVNRLLDNKEMLSLEKTKIEELLDIQYFLQKRLVAMENKNITKTLLLIKYLDYYPRKRSWIADMVSVFR